MKLNRRNIHRDLGYFYIGLIISFAFSGILMNHREHWHPEKYTTETKSISVKLPEESQITEEYIPECSLSRLNELLEELEERDDEEENEDE